MRDKKKTSPAKSKKDVDPRLLDQFNDFEVEIPLLLEDLQNALGKSKKYRDVNLDFELSTVDKVEAYYLEVLNRNDKPPYSRAHLDRVIIAYLGEVLLHHAGGEWTMGMDDDFTYGTPIIQGFADDHDRMGFSPVGIRDRLIREKNNGVFKQSLNYCINKREIEADLMRQMEQLAKS